MFTLRRFLFFSCLASLGCEAARQPADQSAWRPDRAAPKIEVLDAVRIGSGPVPWTSLQALDAEAQFHFVVVTDRTGAAREGPWADAMAKINLMQPAFVVSVGDLIEGGTEDMEVIRGEWEHFNRMVDTLEPPFFYTAGNHDYSNLAMSEYWANTLGPSYYGFKYKEALFLVLNSNLFGGKSPLSWKDDLKRQLKWLQETLDKNHDVRWTYLFLHQPFWRDIWWRTVEGESWIGRKGHGKEDWAVIEEMLSDRDYTAFAGHTHSYEYEVDASSGPHTHERISLATTGGGAMVKGRSTIRGGETTASTPLLGPKFAEFDHFVWVTMTENGPVIANLLLEGILSKDFDHHFKQTPLNASEIEE